MTNREDEILQKIARIVELSNMRHGVPEHELEGTVTDAEKILALTNREDESKMELTPTLGMIDAGCAAWVKLYPAFPGEKPQPKAGEVVAAVYRAMVAAALSTPSQGERVETPSPQADVRSYPQDLTDDLRHILSMMMWTTGPIAHALRDGGQDIKRKAEDEQAEVMHWLIGMALEHGSEWRAKASDRIREIRDEIAATGGSADV